MLRHRLGVIGAVLTLAGALIAVLALVLPATATGSRPGGKNEVRYYTNDKGNKLESVGEDEDFNIIGKNLDHAVEVFCWADGAADDLDGHGGWDSVTDWELRTHIEVARRRRHGPGLRRHASAIRSSSTTRRSEMRQTTSSSLDRASRSSRRTS